VAIRKILIVLLVAALAAPGLTAQSRPIEMRWSELAPMIVQHHVTLTLADGTSVRGEAVAVRDDVLLMDVSKAAKGYAKGSGSVPRSSITLIDVDRTKGSWGRAIGTVIGALAGVTLGAYTAFEQNSSGGAGTATFLAIAAAGSVTGYFVGRSLDKRVMHIRIVP
jgi:hypothetical protein